MEKNFHYNVGFPTHPPALVQEVCSLARCSQKQSMEWKGDCFRVLCELWSEVGKQ